MGLNSKETKVLSLKLLLQLAFALLAGVIAFQLARTAIYTTTPYPCGGGYALPSDYCDPERVWIRTGKPIFNFFVVPLVLGAAISAAFIPSVFWPRTDSNVRIRSALIALPFITSPFTPFNCLAAPIIFITVFGLWANERTLKRTFAVPLLWNIATLGLSLLFFFVVFVSYGD